MGQSNMVGQYGSIDPVLDAPEQNILQWGRNGGYNGKIMLAYNPLQNVGASANTVGMGLNFAKAHYATISGRGVLLVPCAQGGTGFSTSNWNPGDALYEDAISRINAAIASRPNNTFKGVLWHQGEADRAWTEGQYSTALDAMITDLRSRTTGGSNIPFICGNTLEGGTQTAAAITAALLDTPNRVANSAYVASTSLVTGGDNIHFSAASLRTFGESYYSAYTGI